MTWLDYTVFTGVGLALAILAFVHVRSLVAVKVTEPYLLPESWLSFSVVDWGWGDQHTFLVLRLPSYRWEADQATLRYGWEQCCLCSKDDAWPTVIWVPCSIGDA